MRARSENDFNVTVEGVGNFVFGRRKMRDEINIQVEYASLIQGVEPTAWLQTVCGWIAAFKVLMVACPENWDLEEMDPLDQDTYSNMTKVYDALRDKEREFRKKPAETGKEQSKETVS
jgi:hypothetical protein